MRKRGGLLAGLVVLGLPVGTAQAAPERAQSAAAFVDSIGVNVHWTYGDTPYGYAYDKVKALLIGSGIRHVRGDGMRAADLAASGVKTTLVADVPNNAYGDAGTVRQIVAQVRAVNARRTAIDAVEGPNEPDLFWHQFHKGYRGQGDAQGEPGIIAGVTAFQKDLYAALKADPATAKITVIGPALGKTYDPGGGHPDPLPRGSLTASVDWGNFHPYPGGNPFSYPFPYDTLAKYLWFGTFPSANMDTDDGFDYAFDVYAPPFAPKPMAATETGYSTWNGGQNEDIQAKYLPRLFCEYFRHGVRRTYSYEFVDEFADPGGANREAHFGLVRRDLTPKPAYRALKGLIAVLWEAGVRPGFTPGALDYTLTVRPVGDYTRTQYVHHLLLQKGTGDFSLVLWHEISDEDGGVTPHRVVTPPDLPATLALKTPIRRAVVYTWDAQGNVSTVHAPGGNELALRVSDRVMVVQLTPAVLAHPVKRRVRP